jgi:hypothetical protein
VRKFTEKGIALYCVGCEPNINLYKDFFVAISYRTGGQYIPLANSSLLPKVIICGVQEEISLEKVMEAVKKEVTEQLKLSVNFVNEEVLVRSIYEKLRSNGEG